ncbi:hypothetical protein [Thomasclavelia spiroformis]|nr:hypothetical protein [Thomasclavelia spiroformis]
MFKTVAFIDGSTFDFLIILAFGECILSRTNIKMLSFMCIYVR